MLLDEPARRPPPGATQWRWSATATVLVTRLAAHSAQRRVCPARSRRCAPLAASRGESPQLRPSCPPRCAPDRAGWCACHSAQTRLMLVGRDDHRGAPHREALAIRSMISSVKIRIEVPGGLVGEQDLRLVHEGPGDGHALLLAARERQRMVVSTVLESELFEDREHLGARNTSRRPHHLERHGDVLLDGARRQQLEILEHDADVTAQRRDRRSRRVSRCCARAPRSAPRSVARRRTAA